MASGVNYFLFFKGDDFQGFEAETKVSKGTALSQQNSSKGKE